MATIRLQARCKHRKSCVMCDNTIWPSEERKVDGLMHRHLTCDPVRKKKTKLTARETIAIFFTKPWGK